jgi:hypothetical protein
MELYSERTKCIFCNFSNFELLLEEKYKAPLSLILTDDVNNGLFMPYNIMCCNNCNTCQTKYIADLNIVYNGTHIDNYGIIKKQKFEYLFNFIKENNDITGIIEIGACHASLASKLINYLNIPYTIIEPNNINYSENITYIKDYIENVDINQINANTLIMSDVFEHFYNPIEIISKLKESKIKYIYINHPDFDFAIKNELLVCLNTEHTFQVEHQYLFSLFENYGFTLKSLKNIENCSVLFKFEKNESKISNKLFNLNTKINVINYTQKINIIVNKMNNILNTKPDVKFYIWPSSIHSIILFMFGLNYHLLSGILDNSPNKVGKYLYGYNLLCYSFEEIIKNDDKNTCIFIGGAGNYINEINIHSKNIKIYYLNDIANFIL